MAARTKRQKIQVVQPREASHRSQWLWRLAVAIMLLGGTLLTLESVWQSPEISRPAMVAVAVLACVCGAAASLLGKKNGAGWLLLVVPFLAALGLCGPANPLEGMKAWCNQLISGWNVLRQAGVSLFGQQATRADCLCFTLLLAAILGEGIGLLMRRRLTAACGVLVFCLIMTQLTGNCFSPTGCALLVCGILGYGLSGRTIWVTRRTAAAWGICAAAMLLGAAPLPRQEMTAMTRLRESVSHQVRVMRYGEDTLPLGDLSETAKLHSEKDNLLNVQSQQEKNLYLRGFVGSVYEDGQWNTMPDSAYSGEYAGLLRWLSQQGFVPQNQVAQYYALTEDTAPETNQVSVKTGAASRYYLYAPASLEQTPDNGRENKDGGLRGKGLRGAGTYSYQEISSAKPAELTVAADWVSHPQSEAQRQYMQAEAAYRSFVYDNYTQADRNLTELMEQLFWQEPEDGGTIYSAVSRVREVLRGSVRYDATAAAPEETEPVRWFLTEGYRGNDMLYASAAVEALRARGIPARYAEGYYISSKTMAASGDGAVRVSGSNAHAWAEVYFDGIGWLPVDVTPGYYYDALTLQQMVNLPEDVKKTSASLLDNYDATPITGENGKDNPAGQGDSALRDALVKVLRSGWPYLLGLVVLALLATEGARLAAVRTLKKRFLQAEGERRSELIRRWIYGLLGVWDIPAELGWNTEAVDGEISRRFDAVRPGEYARACQLMEKAVYGGIEPESFEERTLVALLEKLTAVPEGTDWRTRRRLRYVGLRLL